MHQHRTLRELVPDSTFKLWDSTPAQQPGKPQSHTLPTRMTPSRGPDYLGAGSRTRFNWNSIPEMSPTASCMRALV